MGNAADALAILDRHAPTERVLSPDRVRNLVGMPSASEIRRASLRPFLKRGGQRKRLPGFVSKMIRAEYAERGTLGSVAKALGISRNWAGDILRENGMGVGKSVRRNILIHNGVKYTFDGRKDYWQTTKLNRGRSLRRDIWQERQGAIPAGHVIIFDNGNFTDFAEGNLRCIPRSQLGPIISAAIRAKTRPASFQAAASESGASRRSRAGS